MLSLVSHGFSKACYMLSDAMSLRLIADGSLTGSTKVRVPSNHKGHSYEFEMKVVDYFDAVDSNQTGILVKIKGDLHLLVSVNSNTNTLSMFIVDGSKKKSLGESKKSLKEVVEYLGDAVVRSFYFDRSKAEWVEFIRD
jgi:hypothetical protein